MRKRILSLLLALCLLSGVMPLPAARAANTTRRAVVYIPLDDRPFNDERVRDMAASLNIELIMPDEDLYTTRLDGQGKNANGTQYGNREELVNWLKRMDRSYDTFIISLDQLLSGGLMNSRCMDSMKPLKFADGTTMTEYQVIDYVAELAKHNDVYVIDSVLRLATSACYGGYTLNHYNIFRNYGAVPRPQLSGGDLTVDKIIANYPYADDGKTLAYQRVNYSSSELNTLMAPQSATQNQVVAQTVLDAYLNREDTVDYDAINSGSIQAPLMNEPANSLLSTYLRIRERKLRLNDYATRTLCGSAHYLLGVDDSSQGNNIQRNEISLLQPRLSAADDQIVSALDGLAQMALSKAFFQKYPLQSPTVSVTYLGDQTDSIPSYNFRTIRESVNQMLIYYGVRQSQTSPDISVVVLTDSSSQSDYHSIYQMVSLLNENEANRIPTILLNLSTQQIANTAALLTDATHLGMLLGYSGQLEQPNGIVMALSQGFSRYRVLKTPALLTSEVQNAHVKNLSTALVKDFGLRNGGASSMESSIASSYHLNLWNFGGISTATRQAIGSSLKNTLNRTASGVLTNLNRSNFITSLSPYSLGSVTGVAIQSCGYPWNRTFEIDLNLSAGWSSSPRATGTLHRKFTDGTTDTTFSPDNNLTREQAVKLLVSAAGTSVNLNVSGGRSDVAYWAWPYVYTALQKGYVKGYPDGSFRGSNNITRAEFCTMLMQYAAAERITLPAITSRSYPDVPSSYWCYSNIMALTNAGIIQGYTNGTFGPELKITRAEALKMIGLFFGRGETLPDSIRRLARFQDVPSSAWCFSYVQEASISHFG